MEVYQDILDDLERGKPESDEWKLFCDSLGWKLYSQINRETGFYQFKAFGTVKHSTDVVMDAMYNMEYRKKWDTYVADFRTIKKFDGMDILY